MPNETISYSINDYANSMFALEVLPEVWIERCADYLRHIFNDRIQGKVVMDYAFGRGNWTLAFLKAGAKQVIAVDAASENVKRFSEYCSQRNIEDIRIVQGNILDQPLPFKADILWVYGILPMFSNAAQELCLSRLQDNRTNHESLLYLYAYNAGSLREAFVSACRKFGVYEFEEDFRKVSYLFTPAARLRARDDLTAPHITWSSAKTLTNLCERHAWIPMQQDASFDYFLKGESSEEFNPLQVLCTCDSSLQKQNIVIQDAAPYFLEEIQHFHIFIEDVLSLNWPEEEKKHIGIGLFNTCFTYLADAEKALTQAFIYLMRILMQEQQRRQAAYADITQAYLDYCQKSIWDDQNRKPPEKLGNNLITDYLTKTRIRF